MGKSWRQQLEEVGGYENDLVGVPAGGVRKLIEEREELERHLRAIVVADIGPPERAAINAAQAYLDSIAGPKENP